MGLYRQPKNYSDRKPSPKNCGPIITKVQFLIRMYGDKLSVAEKKELLDILKLVERYNQFLSDEQRESKHVRLNALITSCHGR